MSPSIRVVLAFTLGVLVVSALALCNRDEGTASAPPPTRPPPAVNGAPQDVKAPGKPQPPTPPRETPKLSDLKIGIVNLKDCFDKERVGHVKLLEEEINAKRDELTKDLESREKELKGIVNRINDLPSDSALAQELRRQLVLKNAEFKAKRDVGNAELKEMVRKFRADIYEEVLQAVRLVSTDRKLDLVLKADAPATEEDVEDKGSVEMRLLTRAVLFHSDSIDITEDVVKRLNQLWEQKKAATPKDKDKDKKEEKK